jgi:hypothetical protein
LLTLPLGRWGDTRSLAQCEQFPPAVPAPVAGAFEPILQLFHLQRKAPGLSLGRAVKSQRQFERDQALSAQLRGLFDS